MDFKQIKELIKLVNDSKIGEVLIENDDLSLRIRHLNYQKKAVVAPSNYSVGAPLPINTPPSSSIIDKSEEDEDEETESTEEGNMSSSNLITVKSPMIGTFYRSSSPDKPPYVKVGDQVNKEDVLCIIEAMKLFNEIESEFGGKIVKVLVESGTPIEYDQPLFLIDPMG